MPVLVKVWCWMLLCAVAKAARATSGELAGTDNKLLVNHNEMLKIYKEIAGTKSYFRKKDFMKPTPFINAYRKAGKRADVVLIDEGHLLLTTPDPYNKFRGHNQLAGYSSVGSSGGARVRFPPASQAKEFWTPALLKRVTRLRSDTLSSDRTDAGRRCGGE